jgi:hypothetical protein
MFLSIIKSTEHHENHTYPKLEYYLNRHIELDGDQHGPRANEMNKDLCGLDENKWKDVENTTCIALEKRIALWDSIALSLNSKK